MCAAVLEEQLRIGFLFAAELQDHRHRRAAEREAELLSAINATGIGPAALGGGATALAVHLETAPCHIAALPVAVNMGCSAMRSASLELIDWGEGK